VQQHQRSYPKPQLAAEREVIAVEALLALGRRTAAEQRAQALIDRAPQSIYAKRLGRLLGSANQSPTTNRRRVP